MWQAPPSTSQIAQKRDLLRLEPFGMRCVVVVNDAASAPKPVHGSSD